MPASRRPYWWLILLLLISSLLVAGYFWHNNQQRTPQYTTVSVTRGDVEDSITALGTLEPLNSVDVGTQVSGQLKRLHVEPGDEVDAGDLLAEIDPTIYLARVEASTAQLANQRAQLTDRRAQQTLARLQAERQRELFSLDATSEEALQTAEAALLSANAQIEALQAQIRQTESGLKGDQADLNYTRIYAPMPGTVVEQLANQGQTLNANQTAPIVVQIADLATMTVRTQVSEADISRIKPGMPVYFSTLGQPQLRWESSLRQILPTPEIINNVVLFNALFDVPNPDNALLPKMSAQVFFVRAAAEDVLTVPVAALQPMPNTRSSDRFMVRVMHQGIVEEREVRVGVRNRVVAEVIEGLNEGEQVITGQALNASGNNSSGGGMPRRMR
ncbi:MAG: efflux RND transporter periplasmic adaptor subunit [Pseudomonadaceae bacterium]|nr:MAG: efflux RND transporter periplasmic adaptor subunit [Pseudomonadaceae bacterium]